MSDTLEQVKAVVSDKLGAEIGEITEDTRFQEDLEADSLDLVELIMALEDEYSIQISDEEAQEIRSIKDAVTYIEAQTSG
jgi:acyl carrier protein